MYTQDQVKANIDALQKQGASNADIQGWLDSVKGKVSAGSSAPANVPQYTSAGVDISPGNVQKAQGELGDFVGAIAKPFVTVGSSIEKGLDQVTGRPVPAQIDQQSAKSPLDFAGNTLEAASYGMAPLKGVGGGFWGAVRAVSPKIASFAEGGTIGLAGAMGAGAGLESAGKGDDIPTAVTKGLETAGGVLGTAGLFGYGGDLIKNYGAKLMQNGAVQNTFSYLKDLADKTFTSLPEAFQGGFSGLSDMASKNALRTADALKQDFNQGFGAAKNAVIDAAVPVVNQPEVATSAFNHALSDTMGKSFEQSNAQFDAVKSAPVYNDSFPSVQRALDQAPSVPVLGEKATPAEFQAFQDASAKVSDNMGQFVSTMKAAIGQKLNPGQVMGLWNEALSYLPNATNEEKVTIRNVAAGLYSDMKQKLATAAPEVLNQWETAWHNWGNAVDLWNSPVLNELKSPGGMDNYIQKITSGTLTPPEQNALATTMQDPNMKSSAQNLMMSALLRTAKLQPPEQASKLIGSFLDKFGDTFFDPQARAMLGNMSQFFDSNFEKFVQGMRGQLPGLAEDTAAKLADQQGKIDAFKVVEGKGLDQVTEQLAKVKDSPEFAKIVQTMPDEEKKAIGLAVTKDFFDKSQPIATQLPDGKFEVQKSFSDSILKTWDMLSNNKALQEAVGPDVVAAFKNASGVAENLSDASYVDDAAGLGKLYHAALSALYLQRGWVPGAISNAAKILIDKGGQEGAKFSAIQGLVDSGIVKPGIVFTMGDIISHLVGPTVAKVAGPNINE